MVGTKYIGTSFPFFLVQAVAITFEDAVIGSARRLGFARVNALTRLIGYVWVAVWFYFTAPGLSWIIGAGFGMKEALPFSPTRMLLGLVARITGISLHIPL